jgi:hypothetical protein
MSDVRTWAAELVAGMTRDEIMEVVAEGAEGFRDSLDRTRAPSFGPDELEAVLDDVERLCRERAAVDLGGEDEPEDEDFS